LAFEAAARRRSLTAAADELCVSLPAVSRQVRQLEERLGSALFVRKHRGVELTRNGRRLQSTLTESFEHVAQVVEEIAAQDATREIVVATTVAFATYWFAPRLSDFRRQYPRAEVRVLASDRQQDLLTESVDIALTCGWQERAGWLAEPLFSEVVFPVCSPDYLAAHRLDTIAELPDHSLLHLDERHWQDVGWEAVDWAVWLSKFGFSYKPRPPVVSFNNYPMLVEAALAGEGIALGWQHLLEPLVAERRLIRPLMQSWDFRRSYFLAVRERSMHTTQILALRDLLLGRR
jgi:DNA-binding transcriptional LysR family regulator